MLCFSAGGWTPALSVLLTHTVPLCPRGQWTPPSCSQQRHCPLTPCTGPERTRERPFLSLVFFQAGVSARTCLQVLWETVAVITLALGSLVDSPRFKALAAPSHLLPLPLCFLRRRFRLRASVLSCCLPLFAALRLLQESGGFLCRCGVGVLVKKTLRDDVGRGWIREDRFYF